MRTPGLLALLAPPRCVACAASCEAGSQLCAACRRALSRASPPPPRSLAEVDVSWAVFAHQGVARELVVALKFRALLAVAGLIAEQIVQRAPEPLLRGTLVPVPAAPARLRRRGFDPAEEIVARLAVSSGLPPSHCLARADGDRQVGRSRAARIADPPRVRSSAPAPTDALLVDDVMTTGATLTACARALRDAGAQRITAVTFARST